MPATLLITKDGSHSLCDTRTGETYHSIHGAVQESRHIFIERGLLYRAGNSELNTSNFHSNRNKLNIFEVGFGTGLNALLTWIEAEKRGIDITYTTVELHPVAQAEWERLNYGETASSGYDLELCSTSEHNYEPLKAVPPIPLISFHQLHTSSWGTFHPLSRHFSFRKLQVDFTLYTPDSQYDLIYFDAFSPEKQPELWLPERFIGLAKHCNPKAILTTYCAKGIVKQALRSAGFVVERLKGPPGKRHMLRGSME